MAYLLDTGILLRLVDDSDAQHGTVRDAVDLLIGRQEDLHIASQNIAEFWNVATRPSANNGLSLSTSTVAELFAQTIEPICSALPEQASTASTFVRLLTTYNVVGKQVHDARLVAMMLSWQVDGILTLNERNFRRFEPEGISIATPGQLLAP